MPKPNKDELERTLQGKDVTRKLTANTSLIDSEKRSVPFIIISKDNEGERYDWWKDEIYLERLDVNGANYERLKTFFKDHIRSVDNAIGKVENIRLEDGELKCDVIFGSDEDSEKIFKKYQDGVLTDCSIGYRVNTVTIEERKDDPDIVTVTDFDIRELSAVGIGFDQGATVGRNDENIQKEKDMNEQLRKELNDLRNRVDGLNEKQQERLKELERMEKNDESNSSTKTSEAAVTAERTRVSDIQGLVSAGQIDQQRANGFISDGTNMDQVRKQILDEKVHNSTPVVTAGGFTRGEDFTRAITDALVMRCGVKVVNPHEDVDMFRHASLLDIAREMTGFTGYDKQDLAARAMSTDDFTLLLGNVANRSIAGSFEEEEGTYHLWTEQVELPDFRTRTEVGLSNSNGRLRKLTEKGESKNIEFGENGESWKLESYGEKFMLTRQMIVNDDLGVFTNIISQFGEMAKRTANGLVYDMLQSKGDFANFKMADGKSLFDASTHKNYTATGTLLNTESLTTGRTSMRRQKHGAQNLNISPKYLLVSPENEARALQLIASEADPSSSNSGVKNIHKNSVTAIVDSELSALPWYLAAGRNTIKTATLQGSGGVPQVQQNNSSLSGTEFECVFDFGVMASNFRGLYKNNGSNS